MKVLSLETNLNEIVGYIYFFFKQQAKEKGIKLHCEQGLPLREANVYSDKNKITAILINLVRNAIKFTEEGIVKFGYERKGASLIFFVRDTGIGIQEDEKNIISARFERVSTKLIIDNSGDGLGLSVSKAYVSLMGGRIWVESEFDQGAAFFFSIPYNSAAGENINKEEQENTKKVVNR